MKASYWVELKASVQVAWMVVYLAVPRDFLLGEKLVVLKAVWTERKLVVPSELQQVVYLVSSLAALSGSGLAVR